MGWKIQENMKNNPTNINFEKKKNWKNSKNFWKQIFLKNIFQKIAIFKFFFLKILIFQTFIVLLLEELKWSWGFKKCSPGFGESK